MSEGEPYPEGNSKPLVIKVDRSRQETAYQEELSKKDQKITEMQNQLQELAQKSFDEASSKAIEDAERLGIPIPSDLSTPSQLEFLKSQIEMKQESHETPSGIVSLQNRNTRSGNLERRVWQSPEEARVQLDIMSRDSKNPAQMEAYVLREKLAEKFLEEPLRHDAQDLIKAIGSNSLTDKQQQEYMNKTSVHPLFGPVKDEMYFEWHGFKIPHRRRLEFNELMRQGKL